jgi:hypothetical protein
MLMQKKVLQDKVLVFDNEDELEIEDDWVNDYEEKKMALDQMVNDLKLEDD